MAAGSGVVPRDKTAPLRAARSAANYPHLVAQRLGLDLVDVTYSGATTAHVLTDPQNGEPPQIDALDGWESLVTVTIGGNDVGYVPLPTAAALPGGAFGAGARRSAAGIARPDRPRPRPRRGGRVAEERRAAGAGTVTACAGAVRRLPDVAAAGGRERIADASRDHHAWSATPWTTKPSRLGLPIPCRPFPAHPNAAGMRAVADLIVALMD